MNISQSQKSNKTKIYIDEVGRGALAGEIMVGCVIGEIDFFVTDSKLLRLKKRQQIYEKIFSSKNIKFSTASSTNNFIDKRGLTKATRHAILKGIKKLGFKKGDNILIVMDGKFDYGLSKYFEVQMIIGGDRLVPQIGAASIVAKIQRDIKMKKLAKKFGGYGLEKNVGYGSLEHRNAIKKFGLTKYHRKSFCKNLIKK